MDLRNLVLNKISYNAWANGVFVELLSTQPDEILNREMTSSCPTILATFKHIWEAQEYWTGIVGEIDDFVRVWEMENPSKNEIFEGLVANSNRLTEIVGAFSEDELKKAIKIKNQWLDCELKRYEYIEQFIGHALYHRGQLVTMARTAGITEVPMTDFIVWKTKSPL
jgi:uncharacterized damage-inducible protein DinB